MDNLIRDILEAQDQVTHCNENGLNEKIQDAMHDRHIAIQALKNYVSELYEPVELEEGVPVVYVGVHAVKWRSEWGNPKIGFVQVGYNG